MKKPEEESYVIIGGGPSGLAAYNKLMEKGVKKENIILLEKNDYIGGKCKTHHDAKHSGLVTDMGAHWIITNYTEVIKKMSAMGVSFEGILPKHATGIPFADQFAKKSFFKKLQTSGELMLHIRRYRNEYDAYQEIVNSGQPLPDNYKAPFATFAKEHNMTLIPGFMEAVVTGFGYGPMTELEAYKVFDYLGKTAPTDIIINQLNMGYSMLGVQGGFQHFVEKMAEGKDVVTSANVTHIERGANDVTVTYVKDGVTHIVKADTLILATSPMQWPNMGMRLTETEQKCVDDLEYFRYPIGAVHIKNYPAENRVFAEGMMDENFERDAGEIALITTRDNRTNPEDGRLVTVFQNRSRRTKSSPPVDAKQEYDLFMTKLNELAKENGWEIMDVAEYRAWEDYMPTVSYELSMQLERAQMNPQTHTAYCTAALPDGFDIVERSIEIAERSVVKHIFKQKHEITGSATSAMRMLFFTRPAQTYTGEEPSVSVFTLSHDG